MPVIKTKLLLFLLFIFLLCGKGFGQWKGTPNLTMDGNAWEGFYKDINNGYHIGWDSDSIYIIKQSGAGVEPAIVFFDFNPIFPVTGGTGTNGNVQGKYDYSVKPNLPFRADVRIYWTNSVCEIIKTNAAGFWDTASPSYITNNYVSSAGNRELAVNWSQLGLSGKPSTFNFLGYQLNQNHSGSCTPTTYIYGTSPSSPTGGCGYTWPNFEHYWNVPNSDSGSSTINPLNYKCYTFLGTTGTISNLTDIYNFTLNKSSAVITKNGNWRFGGSMAVSDGRIDFSNNSDSLTVSDSLVVSGTGEIDLNNSTGPIWIKKNLRNIYKLKLSNSQQSKLIIGGNFKNWGQLRPRKSRVIMKASSGQTITGNFFQDSSLYRLEIDNTNSITLNVRDSLCIIDSLVLKSGTLETDNANLLRLRNNANVNSLLANSTSYVNGPMLWETYGNTERQFPIGDNEFARIGITPRQNDSRGTPTRIYKAQYFKNGFGSYSLASQSTSLNRVSILEYWNLDELSGTSGNDKDVKVRLYWRTYSAASSSSTDRQDLRVCHYDGTEWSWIDNSPSINDSTTHGNLITSNYINSFSPFTLGTLVSNNLLPVTLTKFYALKNSSEVTLHWQTASEVNCNYFEVWKSNDGINYSYLTAKKGKGNTSQLSNYMAADANPHKGYTYYKLLQYDFNGTMEVFGPIVILQAEQNELVIFPNPANTYVEISTIDNIHLIRFEIFDQKGKRIKESSSFLSQIRTDDLPSGIYLVKAIAKNGRQFSSKLSIIR